MKAWIFAYIIDYDLFYFKIEYEEDGTTILHILGIEHRHSGEIQCVAYNSSNSKLTQRSYYTDLAVLPRPPQLTNLNDETDFGSYVMNSTFSSLLKLNPQSSIEQKLLRPIADIPAYLIRGPDDCIALVGGTVCLTVTYGGYPKPNITWMRAVCRLCLSHFIIESLK